MVDYGHWSVDIVGEFDPAEFYGFVYRIDERDTDRAYIGRKQFHPKSKQSNNWKTYCSSCKELQDLIKQRGKENFCFKILLLSSGKCELSYEEENLQYSLNVLREKLPNGDRKFFNKTIGYRNFVALEKQSEETKRKMSESKIGDKNSFFGKTHSDENKKKISEAHLGKPLTQEHKEKFSKARKGKPKSETFKTKISQANKKRKGIKLKTKLGDPRCKPITDGKRVFLSLREAATLLGTNRLALHRMIENGELRYVGEA